MRIAVIVLAAAMWATQAGAQTRPARVDDAAWLAGRWVGEGLGGQIEETWAPPVAGQMVGHFRLVRNGAPAIYEISLMDASNGALRMRVKHFNPDFVGWEEKDAWHAFEGGAVNGADIRFDDLTLHHPAPNELIITLNIEYASGVRTETPRLRRAPL